MNRFPPASGPHIAASDRTVHLMGAILLALMPAMGFGLYLFGWPAIHLLVITVATALVAEATCLRLAGKPVGSGSKDGSALLTGCLLGMSLPPWAPWWIGVIGAVLALPAGCLHLLDPERFADPLVHLLSGSAVLGAFFIATDPVTSPNGALGKVLFGAGCGLLVYVIRTFGGYPEGVAFAVLLMNAATPVIDHYARPRIYGRTWGGRPLPLLAPGSAPDKRRSR